MPILSPIKELPLPGVKLADLQRFPDERGIFTEIFRNDWKELLGEDSIVQANFSVTYPGIVRAWHKHERGQVDYFLVIRGSIKVCAYDDEEKFSYKGTSSRSGPFRRKVTNLKSTRTLLARIQGNWE